MDNQEIVCYCSNITKGQILAALERGAETLSDIREKTGACTLGKCKELSPRRKCCSTIIIEIIEQYNKEKH